MMMTTMTVVFPNDLIENKSFQHILQTVFEWLKLGARLSTVFTCYGRDSSAMHHKLLTDVIEAGIELVQKLLVVFAYDFLLLAETQRSTRHCVA